MSLVAFLIPPTLDAKQALRLRRVGLAALSYVLTTGVVAVLWAFGMLTASIALKIVAACLVINAGLYAAIRSGFNLRFKDPSLTAFQIMAAMTVLMYAVYHLNEARNIALFTCFVVFLFGIFRLSAREFVMVTLYTLMAYALVINLLMHFRPETIRAVPLVWLSWLVLAALLPCFAFIGGQINALRRTLRESELRFRDLSELSSDFYWESDAAHRVTVRTFADPLGSAMPAFGRGVRIGERRWEVPYLSPDEAGWQAHRAALDAHEPVHGFEFSRAGRDGTESFMSINGKPLFDSSGAFTGYRGVGSNITAKKRAEEALRDSSEKLRLFADNVPAMTTYWDAENRCRFANKVYLEFWGMGATDIIGKSIQEIYGEKLSLDVEVHSLRVLQGHAVTYERTANLRDGRTRHLEIRLVPQIGDHGKAIGYFGVTNDITEHKQAEARIQSVAHHDSLTGLPNRLLFDDRLAQAIVLARRNSSRFALLYLDLDRFKAVNDTMGHGAGDELLQAASARIQGQVRESDTVARVGGDEFTVILPVIARREEAQAVAAKIIAAFVAPFHLGEGKRSATVGTSIGIAVYPEDALDVDGLVDAADADMYASKQAGVDLLSSSKNATGEAHVRSP